MIDDRHRTSVKVAIVVAGLLIGLAPLKAAAKDYLEAGRQAARWIRSSAVRSEQGIIWPADPRDKKTVSANLYSGASGVILFFIEAYHSTGDRSFLMDARAGADHLLASLADEKETGLYTGLSGIGFTLTETFKATGEAKYRQGALRCVELLGERARAAGKGIEWNETADIISGGAGTGLFLLYAARELKSVAAFDLATQAGQRLIELGRAEHGGTKWAMDRKFPRLMPNFSHGTAGVAYFLASLYAETRQKEFLDAALSGAKYLLAIADTEGDGCLVFHHEPDGKDLHYLSWCHGPAGTARLFYRLYRVTGDKTWIEWMKRAARSVMQSGIPERQTPGFWNNVSQCCGSAGVAEFFLNLHRITRERQYLDFSKRVTAQLLAKATRDEQGMRWIQAEHRVRPELLIAQTGYMQGAAGIGMWLLHLDGFERGKKAAITLPDSPFGG
jgi:lantibiotic modifying enzyme